MKSLWFHIPLYATLVFTAPAFSHVQDVHRDISRTNERELTVEVDVSFGTLTIARGSGKHLVVIDYEEETRDREKLQVHYDVVRNEGRLKIRLKKSSSTIWSDDKDEDRSFDRKLKLQFSDDVPIAFQLELGAGRGDFDLSGLLVSDLKISTGASSVVLRCDEPNRIVMERVEIESGVSKFTATDLNNINFRSMRFSGGVGSYKLDFGGDLRHDAKVSVEVGLGAVSILLPKDLSTRLLYDDSWFSSFDLDKGFMKTKSGVYVTDENSFGEKRLTIQIESGLGSVKVRRR